MSGTYMLCIKTSSDIDFKLYQKYLKLPRRFADQGLMGLKSVGLMLSNKMFLNIYKFQTN